MDTAKLNMIFGTMTDGVLLIRKGGAVDYINPSARDILGTTDDITTITDLLDLLLHYKINDRFIDLIVKAVAEKGNLQQALVKYQNQSGATAGSSLVKLLEVKATYSTEDEERSVLLMLTDVTQREESTANCRDSAIIVASLLGMFFVYAFALTYLQLQFGMQSFGATFTWACLLGGGIACAVSYRFTSLSLSKSGMRLSNLKGGLILSLRYIPFMLILAFLIKFLLVQFFPGTFPAESPFFDWSRFMPGNISVGHALYPLSALLQEFLARVFIHENIARIFSVYGKNKAGVAAIILSSLFFACVHLHQGFYFMTGAFLLSLVLGLFYHKTSNFWFVVLVHTIVGDIASSLF